MSLYALETGSSKHDPVLVEMNLNGKPVMMEIDTGAAVTVMSNACYKRIGGGELEELEG